MLNGFGDELQCRSDTFPAPIHAKYKAAEIADLSSRAIPKASFISPPPRQINFPTVTAKR